MRIYKTVVIPSLAIGTILFAFWFGQWYALFGSYYVQSWRNILTASIGFITVPMFIILGMVVRDTVKKVRKENKK